MQQSPSTETTHAGSADLWRRLLESLPASAYVCDADGLITDYNSRAVALWGRAPQLNDPADRYCGSFKLLNIDGTPLAHDQSWMALALRENREYNACDIIIERDDSTRVAVLANANPIRDDDGRVLGAINVLADITEQHLAEEALQRANRSKDELLAIIGHELRNPLAPMCNALYVLQRDTTSPATASWAIGVIDRQIKQMDRLIGDLVDVARTPGNQLALRAHRVDLTDVVNTAVETAAPLITDGGHDCAVNMPAEPVYVLGDAARLTQALSNLLTNAAKYSDRNGRIQLDAEPHAHSVEISVRDSGIGIPPDRLGDIFEMFVQAHTGSGRARSGLGIGLTLVKRIVEAHGGEIRAHSDGVGQGSTFTIRLPLEARPLTN